MSKTTNNLNKEFSRILDLGGLEQTDLEQGSESEFNKQLLEFISIYHNDAIEIISDKLEDPDFDVGVIFDILCTIGEIEDSSLAYSRCIQLLLKYLRSDTPNIRHGAIIGLSKVNNPMTIPALESSYNNENNKIIRSILEQVIEYMRM